MLCVQLFFVYLFPFGCFSSLCFVCVCKKWLQSWSVLDGTGICMLSMGRSESIIWKGQTIRCCFVRSVLNILVTECVFDRISFRLVECQNAVYPLQNSLFTNRFSGSDFYGIVNCYEWAFDQMKVTIKLSAAFILMALIQLHSIGISRQWFLNSIPLYSK